MEFGNNNIGGHVVEIYVFLYKLNRRFSRSSKMATELNKALSLEIENFSERKNVMKSLIFSSGGCNW